MPIPGGARYRVKTTSTGKPVRLAFQGGTVVEAKNLKTGAVQTAAEFAADRARQAVRKRRSMSTRLTGLRRGGAFGR